MHLTPMEKRVLGIFGERLRATGIGRNMFYIASLEDYDRDDSLQEKMFIDPKMPIICTSSSYKIPGSYTEYEELYGEVPKRQVVQPYTGQPFKILYLEGKTPHVVKTFAGLVKYLRSAVE